MRSCSWTLPSPPSSRSRAASFARAVVPPSPQLPAAPLRALALSWALPEGWHNARPRAACGATLPRRGAAFLQLDRVRPLPVLCPSPASAPRLHHRESVAACTRLPRARVGLCFFCAARLLLVTTLRSAAGPLAGGPQPLQPSSAGSRTAGVAAPRDTARLRTRSTEGPPPTADFSVVFAPAARQRKLGIQRKGKATGADDYRPVSRRQTADS